jgi:hypothetical protein
MKNNDELIQIIMKKNIKVISIDVENKEFTTNDGNIYPILFDIDKNITTEGFQKAIDDSKKIMLNIIQNNE